MKRKTFGDETRDQDSGSLMLTVSASKYFSLLNIFEYTCINLYDSYNSYYSTHVLAHVPTFSGETTRSPGKVQGSSSRDGLLEGPHKRQMIHVSRHFSTWHRWWHGIVEHFKMIGTNRFSIVKLCQNTWKYIDSYVLSACVCMHFALPGQDQLRWRGRRFQHVNPPPKRGSGDTNCSQHPS